MVSADYIQQGLVQRGLPAHIAQGFVMNMRDESGLNPGINERTPLVPGSRGGYGLYQLTGPRRRAYESYASNRGVSFENADAQLDFLMAELQGPEKRAAQSIFSTNNPQDAAVAIARDFLRPAASNLQKRVASYTGGSSPKATTGTQGAAPMMQQEQKPRGLLGSLGIQKMEEGAEGETGQRFYQRDSFKDTAATLAQGFGRMGIMGMEEIADSVAKQRTEAKAKNKTLEMLGKMGTPQAMSAIEYINAGGAATDALKIAFAKPEKVTPYTDAAKLRADFESGLISQDTYEAEMTKPPKTTAKEAEIARLKSIGIPEDVAIRIADNVLAVSTHPITGAPTLVDKAELLAQQAAQDAPPTGGPVQPADAEAGKNEELGADIFANKNARRALGAVGLGAKIGNVLFDTFGLTPKMGSISEAQNALEFLSTETTLGLAANFPGRPSNLVREEIRELTVKPADVFAGPDKALGKSAVLVKKLDEYLADMQEIVGGEFSPEDKSKARLSIQTLQPIREGYASLNARLREQLEPNSTGGGTALRPEVSEALTRYMP